MSFVTLIPPFLSQLTSVPSLWTAKFTISEFLKRLFSQCWKPSAQRCLYLVRWFLGLTLVAVVISTLTECTPFNHYWQVVPDPGPQCRQGYVQMLTLGTSDMITDLVLVAFPIPILLQSNLPTKRLVILPIYCEGFPTNNFYSKVSLILLFGLSLVLVATTLYRIIITFDRHGNQQFRSLLASVEILAAAAVSNAIVLGSFVRDRGVKKQRFKYGSTSGSSTLDRPSLARTRANTYIKNDSEVDLFKGLGMRLGPEFDREKSSIARPAPVVMPLDLAPSSDDITPAPPSWTFPGREPPERDEIDFEILKLEKQRPPSPPSPPDILTPRRMSFFDVGGLLEDNPSRASSASTSTPLTSAFSSRIPRQVSFTREQTPLGSRKGSNALLRDLGGLLEETKPSEPSSDHPKP